ncbi:MAG: response regulator [Alphaproteobacteria bacterium]
MPHRKLKILMVDDNEADYTLTKAHLGMQSDYDIDIEWASTYDNGLDKVVENDYDACFVDYNIGSNTGLDLARVAREEGAENPIILFSGLDKQQVDNLTGDSQLVEGFVSKNDLSADVIINAMQSILAQASTNNAPQETTDFDEKHVSQFILENLPDPVMTLDDECTITMVNRVFSELMALPPEELLGVNASVFLNCTKPELLNAIDNTKSGRQFRNAVKKPKNGHTHILWTFIKPQKTPNKSFTIIAKGTLGRKTKRRSAPLGALSNIIGSIFKDPTYYKMNDVYIRKDTL